MNDAKEKQAKGKVAAGNAPQTPGGGGESKPKAPAKTPRQRFVAECERRVNQLLKAMVRVGKMGNRKQYEASDLERAAMYGVIKDASVRMVQELNGGAQQVTGFRLPVPGGNGNMPSPG